MLASSKPYVHAGPLLLRPGALLVPAGTPLAADDRATMIYRRVLNRGAGPLRSPLDAVDYRGRSSMNRRFRFAEGHSLSRMLNTTVSRYSPSGEIW
jgi:hypothetical protein